MSIALAKERSRERERELPLSVWKKRHDPARGAQHRRSRPAAAKRRPTIGGTRTFTLVKFTSLGGYALGECFFTKWMFNVHSGNRAHVSVHIVDVESMSRANIFRIFGVHTFRDPTSILKGRVVGLRLAPDCLAVNDHVQAMGSVRLSMGQRVLSLLDSCFESCAVPSHEKTSCSRASLRGHTYTHAYIYIYIHIHTYIRTHACMHTCIHAYMHTCMHTYMHTCIRACMHAYRHTDI